MSTLSASPTESRTPGALDPRDLRYLQDVSPTAHAVLSPNGTIRRADERCAHLFGLPLSRLLGRTLASLLLPADGGFAAEMLNEVCDARGGAVHQTLRTRRCNGTSRALSWNTKWVAGEVYAVIQDVTREVALREEADLTLDMLRSISRIQGRAILEDDPQAVFDFLLSEYLRITKSEFGFIAELHRDEEGAPFIKTQALTNIAWNDETRALFERESKNGLEFRNLNSLFGVSMTSGKPLISNDPANDERRCGLPPGHPPLASFLALPIRDQEGMVGMLGLANRDGGYDEGLVESLEPLLKTSAAYYRAYKMLRTQAAAEADLRQSEAIRHQLQLAHVSRIATTGELAASLAHELNQPLCSILLNARTAQQNNLNEADPAVIGGALEDIATDAERAGNIIKKLREFLRKGHVDAAPLNLNEVVEGVIELLQGVDTVTWHGVETDLEPDLPSVDADQTQIEQVLINLVRNGMEAMDGIEPKERELLIRTRSTDSGGVLCSVSDRGQGIQDPDSLFDPFYTTKSDGMGMGLPISRTIVEAHGGSLHVNARDGGGTEMQFTLAQKPRGNQA